MGTAIQSLCSDMALSCGKRNGFLSTSASSIDSITFRSLAFSANLPQRAFSKGHLILSVGERPIRHSVVVSMAKRYAPNTTKRTKLSRKRGGDPGKKKTRRKGGGKKVFKIIRLSSAAGTGYLYTKKKSRKMSEKLELHKYDPKVKHHVLFTEVK